MARKAVTRDISIEQGATFEDGFVWAEGVYDPATDTFQAGTPYNLTNCQARMQIRKKQGDTALVTLRSDGTDPGITLGTVNGRIDYILTDDQTDLLTAKTAKYDLEVEYPDGKVYRVVQGTVSVDPNITQETDDPPVNA